jgi:hypothetical protein
MVDGIPRREIPTDLPNTSLQRYRCTNLLGGLNLDWAIGFLL